MKSHKNRLDKISQQLPEDEDVAVFIQLSWDEPQPPVTYRRGAGGRLVRLKGWHSMPKNLAGATINLRWDNEELDVESLI